MKIISFLFLFIFFTFTMYFMFINVLILHNAICMYVCIVLHFAIYIVSRSWSFVGYRQMRRRIKIVAVSSKSEARIRRGIVIPFRVVKYVTTLAALSNRDSNRDKTVAPFL